MGQPENVVKNNTPPKNVLTQPDKETQKLINTAKRAIATGKTKEAKAKRAAQGVVMSQLAQMNGIRLTNEETAKLIQGDPATLTKVQPRLKQAGAFEATPTKKNDQGDLIDKTTSAVIFPASDEGRKFIELRNQAYDLIQRGKEEHTKNVLRERYADETNDDDDQETVGDYLVYTNDNKTLSPAEQQRRENEATIQRYQAQQTEQAQERHDQVSERSSAKASTPATFSRIKYGRKQDTTSAKPPTTQPEEETPKTKPFNAWRLKSPLDRTVERQAVSKSVAAKTAPKNFTNFVTKVRQEYQRQLDAGNVKTAQAIADAFRRGDYDKFKKFLSYDEIKAGKNAAEAIFGSTAQSNVALERQPDSEAEETQSYREEQNRYYDQLDDEAAQENSPDELRGNFRNAQNLGDMSAIERREQTSKAGRKQRDLEAKQLEQKSQEARVRAGKEILKNLRDPQYKDANAKIENVVGLKTALLHGSTKAIRQARKIIAETEEKLVNKLAIQQEAKKEDTLLLDVRPTNTPTDIASVPRLEDSNNKSGVTTSRDIVEGNVPSSEEIVKVSNENILQDAGNSKTNNGIVGNTATVLSDSRKEYSIRYKVIEAGDLNVSNYVENRKVFANENYPAELQPRNRLRVGMQAQIISMANNLNPADLLESRNVNQGAPITRNDEVVLNGNGRTAAIKYAYELGKGEPYKSALIENAEQLGLNADAISKMNQPILIRELVKDLSDAEIQDLTTSQTGGSRISASEQAKIDAKKISAEILSYFPQDDNADLTSASAHDFLSAVLNSIAIPEELNELTTQDGRINQDGINRVKRALFALAYGNDGLIARMSESTDDNIRGITNALLVAAPVVAKVKSAMKRGTLHKYDLKPITDAVKKLSTLRDERKTVKQYLQEQSLFPENADSEEMKELLSFLADNKRAPKKFSKLLKEIAQRIQSQGDPRQENLFGETEPAKLIDLIRLAKTIVENDGNTSSFSKQGDVDTTIKNFVAHKDLTPAQKLLQSFGKKLGVKVVFFANPDSNFHGAHTNGIIFINVNSKMPLGKVFWHESMHWLKSNNPKLYQQLVKAAGITDEQRQKYLDKTKRTDLITDEEIDEEILSDQMEDVAKRTGLLQSIAGKNRGLVERIVQWLKDTMNKFIDHFRNPQGKLTTKQAQALAAEFGQIANKLVDSNGQKIFRYNRKTGNIETIDGRKITDIPFGEKKLPAEKEQAIAERTTKYSIGANDNSSQSLAQKIRNRFSSWWNGEPNKNRNRDITDLLYRVTGYKVDFGNIKGADQTIIDDVHKLIRAKHAYEWDKLLPQIGGKIAKTLKLNPTQEMSNYIADWCITGAIGNTSAEAKAFEKAMKDDPVTQGLMLQIREAFQDYHDMSSEEKIDSTLVSRLKGKSLKEMAKILWNEKEEQITDDLHPILRQVDSMIAKAEKSNPQLAQILKEGVTPYEQMRLLRGVGGLARVMIGADAKHIDKARAQLKELYPRLKFDNLVSLNMIVDMAGGKEHVKGLMDYAVAKLDKEMHEKLRKDPTADLRPQFSESVDDDIIKAGEKQYEKAHQALVGYSRTLSTILWDAGVITDNQYAKCIKGWQNYIPMHRVFEETDGKDTFKFTDSHKSKTGSQRNTYDIWETLVQNTLDTFSRAERNRAKQQLAFYARIGDFGDIIQQVETSNPGNGNTIIHFRENGEMKYLKVFDPAVARAVENIYRPADTSWIMKALRATVGFVRAMYTTANAGFAFGNPFRDMQDAFIHARNVDANPFLALAEVFRTTVNNFSPARMWREKSLVAQDEDWVEFNMLGGSQSTFVSEDIDQLRDAMNKLTRKTWTERLKERPVSTVIEFIQAFSEQTECMTRMNTYKRSKANLVNTRRQKTRRTGRT